MYRILYVHTFFAFTIYTCMTSVLNTYASLFAQNVHAYCKSIFEFSWRLAAQRRSKQPQVIFDGLR